MKKNSDRIFEEIVNLSGWHKPFTTRKKKQGLHIRTSFKEGRFITTDDEPISFSIRLSKAELVIWHGEAEPCCFVHSSEMQDDERELQRTLVKGNNKKAALSTKGPKAQLSEKSSESIKEKSKSFIRQYWHRSECERVWLLESVDKSYLMGSPWNPYDQPVIEVEDKRSGSSDFPLSIRAGLICNIDDVIFVLPQQHYLNRVFASKNHKLAAEKHIKNVLKKKGFQAPASFENLNDTIIVADISVEERS